MRILLAAKHAPHGMNPIGGVQTWCRTVQYQLQLLGHEAHTWGPEQDLPRGWFDLGIIANAADTKGCHHLCNSFLSVSHGIITPERPMEGVPTVFTSEGVRTHWNGLGEIVRQPIDTEFWTPDEHVTKRSGIVRYSYRKGLPFLPDLARNMGMPFHHLSGVTQEEARHWLQRAEVVLATGRAALEAAACGAPVVICDHRAAYQGPLAAEFQSDQMEQNYSGRGGVEANAENVARLIKGALCYHPDWYRTAVIAMHDAGKITEQLLRAAL